MSYFGFLCSQHERFTLHCHHNCLAGHASTYNQIFAEYNLRMCTKEDNPGLKNIKRVSSRKISISICVGVVSLVIWLTVWVLLVRVWIVVNNKEHLTLLVYLDSDKCMIEHYIEYRMLIICLTHHCDMNILIYTDSVYWFLHSSLMYVCKKTTRLS